MSWPLWIVGLSRQYHQVIQVGRCPILTAVNWLWQEWHTSLWDIMAFFVPFLCLHMCELSHSFGLHGQTDWTVVQLHLIFGCIASVFTTHSNQLGQKEVFTWQKVLFPARLWDTNMAAILLFRDTTLCENSLQIYLWCSMGCLENKDP